MELRLDQIDNVLSKSETTVTIPSDKALFTVGKIYGVYHPGTKYRVWFNPDEIYPLDKQKEVVREMKDYAPSYFRLMEYACLTVKVLSMRDDGINCQVRVKVAKPAD